MLPIPRSRNGRRMPHGPRMSVDLRRRLVVTALLLLAYRAGSYLPVPGLPLGDLMGRYMWDVTGAQALGMLNMFSGGALSRMSLFALGTMPYITAQIVVQMAAAVMPELASVRRDGEAGRRRMTTWSRHLTVAFSLANAVGYAFLISGWGVNFAASSVWPPLSVAMVVATMVAGALIVMWIGELIGEHGVGNGMSMLIAANILSGIPSALTSSWAGGDGALVVAATLLVTGAAIPLITVVERGQRRVPVTYGRSGGSAAYASQRTYLPIKVNMAGVVPIIFAGTVVAIPSQLAMFLPGVAWVQHLAYLASSGWVSWVATAALIVAFSYFYAHIVFDADETAESIKRQGGFVPGIRPGARTAEYLREIVDGLTLPGALFMAALSVIPTIAYSLCGASIVTAFGGTSMVILVGVVLDTASAIESRMVEYSV